MLPSTSTTDTTRSRRLLLWLRRSWLDLILILILLAMLMWIWDIARHHAPDKATWLIVPITAIYVVTSFWIVGAGLRSANAAADAASIMRETLHEMRLQTNMMYSPTIGFPEGLRCWLKENNAVELVLSNLHNQPALGLRIYIWEMEPNGLNQKECKFSSLRETALTDFPGNEPRRIFAASPSTRPDIEKTRDGLEALKRFTNLYNRVPDSNLCAVTFYTKINSSPIILVYDLGMIRPAK